MKLFEVKDIVRENIGRDKATEFFLKWALDQGLREIEKNGNFYWARGKKDWNTVINQQTYSLLTNTNNGLNLPTFKDIRILLTQDPTLSQPDWDEVFGPQDPEDVELQFATTDEGQPVVYTIEDDIEGSSGTSENSSFINLFPANPDKAYNMRLYYFRWTSLPEDVTSEAHEVLKRWPEALIYTATEAAIVSLTKDPATGAYWRQRFTNKQDGGELVKIHRYNRERSQDSRIELRPMRGPLMSRRQRWRRNREIWL